MENNYPIIIALIALLVFLIYKEVSRTNRARLFIRLLAACIAVFALAFLFFPLKYKTYKTKEGGQLHLITDGTVFEELKNQDYYTTDSSVLLKGNGRNVKYIPDLGYYLQQHQEISGVSLYGNGLEAADLKLLKNYSYNFKAGPLPAGILSCSWPQVLKQAELLNIQGVYNNTSAQTVKVILEGLGSSLDSISVSGHSTKLFTLKTQPRQIGRAQYKLTALRGNDTLQKEKIPFQVISPPKIKLLVLSSFPDFEYKFLKNWLFENNYQVVFRTRISKDKYSVDQLNTSAVNVETLSTAVLSKFDGVIADDDELSILDPSAAASLRSAVTQGLGLLIRMGDIKTSSVLGRPFKLYTAPDSTAKLFTPVFTGETGVLKKLPVNHDLYIQPQVTEQPLVKDQNGKVLLSTKLAGNGKITGSIITSTYNWILEGNTADYASFWSAVINNTIRKEEKNTTWRTVPAMPIKGTQTQLLFQSAALAVPVVSIDSIKPNLLQNAVLLYLWESTFWPQHTGWNEIKKTGNPAAYLFVYDKNDWKSTKQYQMLMENTAYSKKYASTKENNEVQSQTIEKSFSKWWFFALFLLSVGYMWFETKLL